MNAPLRQTPAPADVSRSDEVRETIMQEHPLQQHHEREAAQRRVDGRTIVFSTDTLDALAVHARKRGITVNELARRIVDHVVEDRLVDAVLDDQYARAA